MLDQLSDLAGVASATYLAALGRVTGFEALIAIAAILGVQTGLRRIGSRSGRGLGSGDGGGRGLATAGIAAAAAAGAASPSALTAAVGGGIALLAVKRALLGLGVGALLAGCPLPQRDGCTPNATRCAPDGVPEVCSPTQRWTRHSGAVPCAEWSQGAVCCEVASVVTGTLTYACSLESACLSNQDGGVR
jgi:hypothetical protein